MKIEQKSCLILFQIWCVSLELETQEGMATATIMIQTQAIIRIDIDPGPTLVSRQDAWPEAISDIWKF